MANSAAVCTSFKVEMMKGHHAFGTSVVRGGTGADTFNMALFLAAGSLGAGTTAYAATNEVANTGTYAAGGTAVTNATAPTSTGTTAFWTPSANLSWTGVTFAACDAALLYNATQSNKAVAVFTFSSQSATAGTFTLTMPTNDATTGLLRLA